MLSVFAEFLYTLSCWILRTFWRGEGRRESINFSIEMDDSAKGNLTLFWNFKNR